LQELNPELDLDKELKPGTEFLIYRRDPKVDSRSIGSPERGQISGAAPLPEGEGRIIKATPAKTWATRRTVGLLDAVLRAWPKLEPHGDPLLVGNMARRRGGKLPPHHTHQSGRDVDLGYPQVRNANETYNWRDMSAANLDGRRTWRLLHLLKATGELQAIFIDRSLQKALYDYAIAHNILSKQDLTAWLEYPRAPGNGSPIVQHVPGHVDHLHVRFTCGGQSGCE
jgi:murein endopeptidase